MASRIEAAQIACPFCPWPLQFSVREKARQRCHGCQGLGRARYSLRTLFWPHARDLTLASNRLSGRFGLRPS
jgi:hypothetical protein